MLLEPAPGIYTWTTRDMAAFRAFTVREGDRLVLIDPVALADDEKREMAVLGQVEMVLLTGPWHERASAAIALAYGVPIYAHPDALASFENRDVQPLPPSLPMGLEALHAEGTFAGEVSFYLPRDGGTMLFGDAWQNVDFTALPWPIRLLMKHVIKLRHGLNPVPPVKVPDPQRHLEVSRAHFDRPIARALFSHGEHLLEGAREQLHARLAGGF